MPFALDLDGVIWLADDPIAGSAEAVARLRAAGEAVVFCTNNSSLCVGEVEAKLARHGIPASGDVLTSATAAATLVEPGEHVLVCAGPGVVEALKERGAVPVRDPGVRVDAVMVGFHRDFDYDRLRVACDAVRGGARLLATNDDSTYPTPSGLVPGGGAILAAVETGSGVAAVVAGKPNAPMAALVRQRLGSEGTVVGDRADTDGRFARVLGYRFALVLSGVSTGDEEMDPAPDLIAPDLRSLVERLCP